MNTKAQVHLARALRLIEQAMTKIDKTREELSYTDRSYKNALNDIDTLLKIAIMHANVHCDTV
jgi:hypothetical protein